MKFLKLLFITVLFVTHYSCEDNYSEPQGFLQHENQKITTRSVDSEECGYIEELCKPCPYDRPQADVVFTHGLVINDGGGSGKQYKVQALDIFREHEVYYISDGIEEFIISNTTDEFIKSTADDKIGSDFGRLFKLDHEKLINRNYSNQEIRTDLNANSVADQGDKRIIDLSTLQGEDDDIVYLWRPCNGHKTSTYLDFVDAFNSPNFVSGTGTLGSQVKIAYDKCAENVNLSNSCVDSRCVLENMLNSNNFTWNADQIKKLKSNYLSLILDLDDAQSTEIYNSDDELIHELFILSSCDNVLPCQNQDGHTDWISALIKKSINEEGVFNQNNFYVDLNSSLKDMIEDAYLGNCGDWEEPCWEEVLGEHWDDAVGFSDWCSNYSGFNFGDFNDGGWFVDFDSPIFEDDDYRYVIDPTNNNYVIDMRHFLFVGFFFEVTTGSGNGIGDFIEFGQLFFSHAQNSALNWQDFFSNRMGSAFARYLMESNIDWEDENTNLADLICEFLDSPLSLYLRPFPNPEDC